MRHLLFSDNIHFSYKNYSELFDFLKSENIAYKMDQSIVAEQFKKNWGNLDNHCFNEIFNSTEYCQVSIEDTIYKNYNLEELIQDELFFVISSLDDYRINYNNNMSIYEFAKLNFPIVIQNLYSIAKYWVDYWEKTISAREFFAGITFGGNTIYSKTFIYTLKKLNLPCYIVEHFFTGNDFYMEMRYSPLPNNGYFINKNSSIIHWLDKLYLRNNKNVTQPIYKSINYFNYILILGQVYNDFSVIAGKNKYKNSISFYKELILEILDNTQETIIFKAHPYEKNKVRNNLLTTLEELEYFRLTLSKHHQDRFILLNEFNMDSLFQNSHHAITLTSQSGLESMLYCKPIVTFGDAFYSHKGFTIDCNDIFDYIEKLKNKEIKVNFSFIESYNAFMSQVFDSLVGVGESYKLSNILKGLVQLDSKIQRPISTTKKESNKSQIVSRSSKNIVSVSNKSNEQFISVDRKSDSYGVKRKLKKLLKNPKSFFLDSRYPTLRNIGKFLK